MDIYDRVLEFYVTWDDRMLEQEQPWKHLNPGMCVCVLVCTCVRMCVYVVFVVHHLRTGISE